MAQLERRLSRLEQQVQPEEAQKQKPKRPGGGNLGGQRAFGPPRVGVHVSFLCPALHSAPQGGR